MSTSAQEVGSRNDVPLRDSVGFHSTVRESPAQREDSSHLPPLDLNAGSIDDSNETSNVRSKNIPALLGSVLHDHYVIISRAIDATYSADYALADSLFERLSNVEPDHPVGPLMRAATLQAQMRDYEVLDRKEEFKLYLDTAESRAHTWISNHPDDSWGYCYLGHTYGYRAMWQGHFGSWVAAVRSGIKAKNAYHEAVKRDSLCWDAFLGLGSYHYWKSAKTEFINWTGIIKDQKELGLKQTELALERGIFAREAAAAGMLQIYLHQKQYDRAIALAKKWHAVHPRGKTFLWGQAYAEFEAFQNDSALVRFDSLRARVANDPAQGLYNMIEIDYYRALLLDRVGQVKRACETMNRVAHYKATEEVLKRQKDKLKKARKFVSKYCRD